MPVKPSQIIITVVVSFIYWCLTSCLSIAHVLFNQIANSIPPYQRFNEDGVILDVAEMPGFTLEQISQIKQEIVNETVLCSICLENIEEGMNAKIIPGCLHKFHDPCILPWLLNNSICPYCRNVIRLEINV